MASSPEAAPPRRGKKLPLLAGALLLALGAAGVVYKARSGAGAGEARAPEHDPGIVALDPYVLNLSDPEGGRFLRCSLRIALDRDDVAEKWNTDPLLQTRLRDRIFSSLATRTASELTAPGGREALRARVKATVEPLFEDAHVLEIYFTEFLLQ
jgi:flagellar basal body-associated protein FliL